MKKLVLIVFLNLIFSGVYSQIVIGPGEMPVPGTFLTEAADTMPATSSLPVFETGTNYNWDFTALNSHDTSGYLFQTVSSTPYASDFPTATDAVLTGFGMYAYFQITNDYTLLLGYGGYMDTLEVKLHFIPADTILKFPFTFGTNFSSNPISVMKAFYGDSIDVGLGPVYVDSIRMTDTYQKSITVDGWGTVETPIGTYQALRSLNHQIHTSEIAVKAMGFWIPIDNSIDTSLVIEWEMCNTGVPLISIQANASDSAYEEVNWLTVNPSMFVAENSVPEILVYPNPATDIARIDLRGFTADAIVVCDVFGRSIYETVCKQQTIATISVSDLAPGIYWVSLKSGKQVVSSGRFVKQ